EKVGGERGVGGGCGNVVNPTGFPSFPWPEPGGKGGGDFLFKAPKGPLFGSPFPPFPPAGDIPLQRIFFLLLFLLEVILWLRISRPLWSSCGLCIEKKMSI